MPDPSSTSPTPPDPDSGSAEQAGRRHGSAELRFGWLKDSQCVDLERVQSVLNRLTQLGISTDLLDMLGDVLEHEFESLDTVDAVADSIVCFIEASRSPTSLLALFERDRESLSALLKVFSTSEVMARWLIEDPESFDLLRVSAGQPSEKDYLIDELSSELQNVDGLVTASQRLRRFAIREKVRIAYGEFAGGMVPEQAAKQLATVATAVIQSALDFVVAQQIADSGVPRRVDGTTPEFLVLGLGNLGSEELTYGDNLDLIVLCDQIDRKNRSHVDFYQSIARNLLTILRGDETLCFQVNTIHQPKLQPEDSVIALAEAVESYESSAQVWRRLALLRARVVAGNAELGEAFLQRMRPWIYRRFLTRTDLTELRTVRIRMARRVEGDLADANSRDIADDPGGLGDLQLTIRFLQLLHGGDTDELRTHNTRAAIDALEQAGCLTHRESSVLSSNLAKLTRLEHQLSIIAGTRQTRLPEQPKRTQHLAWQMGLRDVERRVGDADRFLEKLDEMLVVNRKIIDHLMQDPDPIHHTDVTLSAESEIPDVPLETELILDPNPEPKLISEALQNYGFADPKRVMEDLSALATESCPFLSPRRCRHFFAALVPDLLVQVSETPNPLVALNRLVGVTDSIGGKASLWELFRTNPPTLRLMVRMAAVSPYLSNVLMGNPGMIDELIDSLVIDRLPSTQKLDAQAITLCRNAVDLDMILKSFKDAAHLQIGVREILGKEQVRQTHRALADTADAVIRRVLEHEQEKLASRFGDPMADQGKRVSRDGADGPNPSELIAIAFGKLGGREPNYHSDLDVLFLFTEEGNTHRRVGGPRATTTNQHFFNELTRQIVEHVNRDRPGGRLYDLDSRLRPTDEEGILSVPIETFLRRFLQGVAPLWQRLALCKARPVTGSKVARARVSERIAEVLRATKWHDSMMDEAVQIRRKMQQAAGPTNFKRGIGGTVDVELLTQVMTLRHVADSDDPRLVGPDRVTGTMETLQALSDDGRVDSADAQTLADNYQTIRTFEAGLRLMDFSSRHELPDDDASLRDLAFLNETTVTDIQSTCEDARRSNREIFDRWMKRRS
ncbi:MAG: glutamate-ammonia-ligase adenylyltransferase [Planctomycetota bacterium]